jgi:CBS domain-containing protein
MKPSAAVAPYLDSLVHYAPFSEMSEDELARLFAHARVSYHAAGETLVALGATVQDCWLVLQGRVRGERGQPGESSALSALELTAGEMFPVGALLTSRPTISRFFCEDEAFIVRVPAADFVAATRHSAVLADFCDRRLTFLLERSRRALQASYAAHESAEQQLPRTLASLIRRPPVSATGGETVRSALTRMQDAAVGSIVIVDDARRPVAIVTERDIIPRVVLAGGNIDAPVSFIATSSVSTLPVHATATDAALLMAEHGFRHVVVVDGDGALAGIVSERDLFALQRHTLTGISGAIGRAGSVGQLAICAADARQLARNLIAQGIEALTMTRFVSHLNDQITRRLLDLMAQKHGLKPGDGCWLALGSEGRHEQTISTDQDNALILGASCNRERALAAATEVNAALAECGFPLCRGNIMAGNPALALTVDEWRSKFESWIERGDPQSLLQANVFFDLRPLWGDATLAETLRADVLARAAANERFLKQLAHNALAVEPPLNWLGNLSATDDVEGRRVIDLKRFGVRPFVDAARVLALAHACTATSTVERLRALAAAGKLQAREVTEWADAFSFVQGLRMRAQERSRIASAPNAVAIDDLSPMDARILKECFRQARTLQQRLAVDYP